MFKKCLLSKNTVESTQYLGNTLLLFLSCGTTFLMIRRETVACFGTRWLPLVHCGWGEVNKLDPQQPNTLPELTEILGITTEENKCRVIQTTALTKNTKTCMCKSKHQGLKDGMVQDWRVLRWAWVSIRQIHRKTFSATALQCTWKSGWKGQKCS